MIREETWKGRGFLFVFFFFNDPSRCVIASNSEFRRVTSCPWSLPGWLTISLARPYTRAYTREYLMPIPAVFILTNYTIDLFHSRSWMEVELLYKLRLYFFFYKNRIIYGDIIHSNFVHTENGHLRKLLTPRAFEMQNIDIASHKLSTRFIQV